MLRYGTNHFLSWVAACRYYKPYGFDHFGVNQKIREGEIVLGRPEVKPGERAILIDDGTRWAIEKS